MWRRARVRLRGAALRLGLGLVYFTPGDAPGSYGASLGGGAAYFYGRAHRNSMRLLKSVFLNKVRAECGKSCFRCGSPQSPLPGPASCVFLSQSLGLRVEFFSLFCVCSLLNKPDGTGERHTPHGGSGKKNSFIFTHTSHQYFKLSSKHPTV